MGLLYEAVKASQTIKKDKVNIDLAIGDKVSIKTKSKGKSKKQEIKGKVLMNKKEHPFFIIDTGKYRTSFLKVDALIGAIQVRKIN